MTTASEPQEARTPLPEMSAIYDPGPPASMEIRASGGELPEQGDLITNEGWYGSTTHRVREVISHGNDRYTVLLGAP
jgi:hypothetical protein